MQLGRRRFVAAVLSLAGVAIGEKTVGAPLSVDDVADQGDPDEDGCVASENVEAIKLANLMR
ncbi:MAG: hypothetical protein HKP30_09370 [Myxococcales bacterium]|nr:hypothetical protein [Myxococcales bacterium]